MLTSADIQNVSNSAIYINETEKQLLTTLEELGQVLSPESAVYSSLSTILIGLDNDLTKLYNRVCQLNDDDYVAY
jgi:hypothetical protein